MSQKLGLSVIVTALVGMAAGLLGAAGFSYWRDARANDTGKPLPVSTSDNAESAAALKEVRALLARERRERSSREATAPIAATITTEPASEAPPLPEEPELSLEEQAVVHVERHEATLDEHEKEPRDPSWAPSVEASLLEDLNALPALGGRAVRVDCKMTTCVAEVQWQNYAAAVDGYKNVLHGDFRANCGRGTVLPEPEQPEQPYLGTFVFDCESQRAGD